MPNTSTPLTIVTLSAAAAGTFNSEDQINPDGNGVHVILDITVATTTSVVLKIQGKDLASGKYYDILTSAAKTSAATTVLTVFPGATAATNVTVNEQLPRVWRVNCVVTGASSALTATVGANVVV